jgi:8-amino-7-oxononanoate synthase
MSATLPQQPINVVESQVVAMSSRIPQPRTEAEIRTWLVDQLTTHMNIDRADIRLDEPLVAHGIDSMHFLALVGELEEWLGCRFKTNPLIEHSTINSLSQFLAGRSQDSKTSHRQAD